MRTCFTHKPADRNLASLVILCLLVFLGVGLLQTQRLAAQGEEPPQGILDEELEPLPLPATPEAFVTGESNPALQPRQSGQARLYLPLLSGRPQFTAQFAAEVDDNLNPVAPMTEFPADTRRVYAVIGLNGLAGQRWSTQWYRNNTRISGASASGSVPAGQQEARMVRRLSYANNGPLPAGAYKIVVSINGRPAFDAALRILP